MLELPGKMSHFKKTTTMEVLMTRKGDKIKRILTERFYEVKGIKDWVVVLESLDGLSQVRTKE